jgi:type I restriction enzyme S subunit
MIGDGVEGSKYISSTKKKIRRDGVSRSRLVRAGDLLLTNSMSFGRPYILDTSGCIHDGWLVLSPRSDDVVPDFFYHLLGSAPIYEQFSRLASGAVVKNLNIDLVKSVQIAIPPRSEQLRIADILDRADSIRRKRKEAIALTEDLLRSAFLEMVGPGATEYKQWPVRTIESLAASTPNSMRTGPFGSDLLHSEFVDEGIAVLGIDNAVQNRFTWGERRFIAPEKYENLRRYTVSRGDVIVTIMGTTGRSAVVPDDIPTAITTKHLATITLDPNQAEPEFVSQALFRHPEVLRQIAAANRGAIMSGLNLGLIKALRIPIPPPARQRKFARVTLGIRGLAKRMEKHRQEEELFESLMARAFSGQLSTKKKTY